MARFDLETVHAAASNRWVDILSTLGGVSPDVLDGRQHPCPKHCMNGINPVPGGKDRFRLIDPAIGGCFCNNCFNTKNRDGFAALQWLTGDDFASVLEKVAKFVGVKPEKRKKADPAEHLEFLHWNRATIGVWCEKKKPIVEEAIQRVGGRLAKYRGEYTVIAIPVWGPQFDIEDPVGYALYRADGGMLPAYIRKGEPPEWKKILLTAGSEKGVIGDPKECSALVARQAMSATTGHSAADSDVIDAVGGSVTWWKLEGPSDLLTAMSQSWPTSEVGSRHRFFTTANGATEKPLDWIVELFANQRVIVCHDCDLPGQRGATWIELNTGKKRSGWAPRLAERAAEVRNVVLPYEIAVDHGPDLRDFFSNGGTVQELLEIVETTPPFRKDNEENADDSELDETDATRLAEVNLAKYRAQGRDLRKWNDAWYQYKGKSYSRLNESGLKDRLWQSIHEEFVRWWKEHKDRQDKKVTKVTGRVVSDTLLALGSKCRVPEKQEMHSWIDGGPRDCIALQNGILCLSELFKPASERDDSKILLPHSPKWFSTVCLPYAFDHKADCPSWISFLNDVFNQDEEQIGTLQKWFGLMLTPITQYHKMLCVIGQTRSGKGTIQKVLMEMLGSSTVATPSLSDLSSQFSLSGLLDKTVAIIPDARLSGRADSVAIVERLLSLTACDPIDVNRKYLDPLTGVKLRVRFTLFSNMLPRLGDDSAAFVDRCVFLLMPNSYLGREDYGLIDRLLGELPGILNWSICGMHRLLNGERFTQPQTGQGLLDSMRLIVSPMSTFLSETCSDGGEAFTDDMFEAYCNWSRDNDIGKQIDKATFIKKLKSVRPDVTVTLARYTNGNRSKILKGITLRSGATF